MVSLASRSCHRIHHEASLDSTKKSVSSAKQMVNSHMKQIPKSISGTAKKLRGSSKLLEKNVVSKKSAIKARFVLRICTYFISFGYLYFYQIMDIDFVLLKEIV